MPEAASSRPQARQADVSPAAGWGATPAPPCSPTPTGTLPGRTRSALTAPRLCTAVEQGTHNRVGARRLRKNAFLDRHGIESLSRMAAESKPSVETVAAAS
jgi:hypothetical protein